MKVSGISVCIIITSVTCNVESEAHTHTHTEPAQSVKKHFHTVEGVLKHPSGQDE